MIRRTCVFFYFLIILFPGEVLAQGAAQAALPPASAAVQTTVDITQLLIAVVTSLLALIGTVLSVLIPIWINKIVKDKQAAATVEQAIQNSLGKLQQAGTDLATTEIQKYHPTLPVPPALQPALQYVADHASAEADRLGLTPEAIADKIVSRLGLENIKTNQALTSSAAPVQVDGTLSAPVIVPPLAPVPNQPTAVVPPVVPPLKV